METFFSISLDGTFVFRTETFGAGAKFEVARVKTILQERFPAREGFAITQYERPGGWDTQEIAR